MEIATRVELAFVHKMVMDGLIAGLKDGTIPQIDVLREEVEDAKGITITVRVGAKK